MLTTGACLFYGIDMYNNTKKVIERYIERVIKIVHIQKNFYLFRQGLLWLDFVFENLHFSNYI